MDHNNDNDTNNDNNNNINVSAVSTVVVGAIDGNTTSIGCITTTIVDDDTARIFFQEQHDLVSEIFSFLDVQSLLLLCSCITSSTTNDNKTVPFSSILRYD
eukprot:CAMPEP_0170998248 /NCGR_PEP_ID=MMETSP0736-20130129/13350_1 /TAXON_ID=186038 /ORGANISM="Fragilariopsis kerguelensis, Strain L26-C5" /LENGTH=100 /DNA_ID=CAMNT_0011425109 /DNA_START=150 /DNA_END=449 /DNA_ORIENTATION=+